MAPPDFKLINLSQDEIVKQQQERCDAQKHLARQTLEGFDPALITPLNPEIISR